MPPDIDPPQPQAAGPSPSLPPPLSPGRGAYDQDDQQQQQQQQNQPSASVSSAQSSTATLAAAPATTATGVSGANGTLSGAPGSSQRGQHESRHSSTSSGIRHNPTAAPAPAPPRPERQRPSAAMALNLHHSSSAGGEATAGGASGEPQRAVSNPLRTASPQNLSPLLPMADPHHRRTPSLGELHQQLEQEQEAQVV
jgi:hypothetical protein